MTKKIPERMLSKSKLSMYLRSQCDRQLYLSLFKNNPDALKAAGLPVPLKTRPNVQLVTKSGRDFELEQFDTLVRAIPDHVIHANKYAPVDLTKALLEPPVPCFVLQPAIEPQDFRDIALDNLGLNKSEKSCVPKLSGLRPDVLYIHEPSTLDYEVLPNGFRRQVGGGEKRLAISVIDLKNVTEANASYAAEVCLYAFFLSNWLATEGTGLNKRYFVSDQVYLWQHVEMPRFQKMLGLKEGAVPQKRIKALLEDLKEGLVDFLIYMPSVKKFFKEDVPRVVQKGDQDGWDAVPYHVNPKCGACDWLGNKEWLWGDDLKHYESHATDYCLHAAESSDHLCKMSGLSKGASQILVADGHKKVANLVGMAANTPVLKKHALLKRDKSQIGERAKSLSTETVSVDAHIRVGGLAKFLNAEYDIIVNFDAGAGLLTGISIRGIFFPPLGQGIPVQGGAPAKFHSFHEEAFVVGKDFADAEWVALYSFISTLSSWAMHVQKVYDDNNWGKIHTQVCFWEARQYKELCNAFSRHLLKVLELPDKEARALAWIFPAEELMEREEEIAPGIVFIRDIADVAVRLPVRFSNTLLGVAGVYHHQNMPPRKIDTYYREPLGNAIPRERIFEIWKCTTGVIKMYGKPVSIADATKKYGDVLKSQAWALSSVTARLRTDLKDSLEGAAPEFRLSNPTGATKVAYDSKLWMQWDEVETATAKAEGKLALIAKSDRLESSYKTIVLPKLIKDFGGHRYEFEVSDESTEAKLEEGGGYYVLGFSNNPGFPLQTPSSLGISPNPPTIEFADTRRPMHSIITVTLEKFDRVTKKAIISLRPRWHGVDNVFNELFNNDLIPITTEPVCILEGLPYDDTRTTKDILKAIGNPACAVTAPEAMQAMGAKKSKTVAKGTDADTPVANVLWQADALSKQDVRTDGEARNIVKAAQAAALSLNDSQTKAVYECAKSKLSVIWGPPGTGKTNTLVSLLHALVSEGQKVDRSRKILVTGPNYRAVEEIAERLLNSLDSDASCSADMFWVYSQSRETKTPTHKSEHLYAVAVQPNLNNPDQETKNLKDSLTNKEKVTIVATTAHIVKNLTALLHGAGCSPLQEIFDFIVIDESSQVPVTLALRPLSVLKSNGQLVIAGDHLQMPPISSLEPPKEAGYLVGSIQTYLLERFKLPKQELLINYRSNQDLVDYAKTLGYPPKLEAQDKDRQVESIEDLDKVISSMPNTLPKTSAYKELILPERKVTAFIHDDIVSSQANEVEAKLVAGLAYCLRHSMSKTLHTEGDAGKYDPFTDDEFFQFGLGVVTPHKAQKALVLKELMTLFSNASPQAIFDAVDTVERFQGGERQTIIVSFGVGDLDIIEGEEAFLLQMERTNVAVSRAKAKCIVLMPKALAYHLPTEPKTVKTAKAIKSYIEEFCANRVGVEIDSGIDKRSGEVRWH